MEKKQPVGRAKHIKLLKLHEPALFPMFCLQNTGFEISLATWERKKKREWVSCLHDHSWAVVVR